MFEDLEVEEPSAKISDVTAFGTILVTFNHKMFIHKNETSNEFDEKQRLGRNLDDI